MRSGTASASYNPVVVNAFPDGGGALRKNDAVTVVLAFKVKVQVAVVLEHPPEKPPFEEPGPAVSFSVIEVPVSKVKVQVAPQLIPAGVEATVPVPVPAFVTVTLAVAIKVAVTVLAD